MVRASGALAAGCLVISLLAGCGQPATANGASLAREITLHLGTESGLDAAGVIRLAQAVFTYTHAGAPLDVSQANVQFTTPAGMAAQEPLSAFTTRTTLNPGDVVRIPGASITSDFRITAGSQTVAERTGTRDAWLHVAGHPMPLSTGGAGSVAYTLQSTASVGFDIDRLAYAGARARCTGNVTPNCPNDGFTLANGTLRGAMTAGGTFGFGAAHDGSAVRLTFSSDLSGSVNLTAEAQMSVAAPNRTLTFPTGIDSSFAGRVNGTAGLVFSDGALTRVGSGGRVQFSGHAWGWDQNHTKAEHHDSATVPSFDHAAAYSEYPVPSSDPSNDSVSQAFAALWDVTLQPGDRITLDSNSTTLSLSYQLDVVGEEARMAGGQNHDALKLHSVLTTSAHTGATTSATLSASDTTFWVDALSYLPLYVESQDARELGSHDLDPIVRMMPGVSTLPSYVHALWRSHTHLEATGLEDGLHSAALVSTAGALLVPVMAEAAVSGYANGPGTAAPA
ncbi:MAG: hypothetical protein ACYDBQ_00745 [Thermoplasmatota archaeon]